MNVPAARRPLVVAHRGASSDAPEHTLGAYLRAIEDGADGLEADVRLTADGHLVCVHDRKVDRTSSGSGVLSTLELADLESLDFGSWKVASADFEAPDQLVADHRRVLTLERLLELVVDAPRPVDYDPHRGLGRCERTAVVGARRVCRGSGRAIADIRPLSEDTDVTRPGAAQHAGAADAERRRA